MGTRSDSKLSPDELRQLVDSDYERYCIEWTYRLFETQALSESPDAFIQDLAVQYQNRAAGDFVRERKSRQMEAVTAGYFSGHLTLAGWARSVRTVLTGHHESLHEVHSHKPEATAAFLHVYSHLLKRR